MSVIKREVCGEPVTLNVVPPAWPEMVTKFERWQAHVVEHEIGVAGLDVETTGIDEVLGAFDPAMRMRLIQFGSARYAWALDPHDEQWRPHVERYLARGDLRHVSHTNYDPLWVAREYGITLGERSIDTLPMATLLHPGHTPKDLKSLSTRYLDNGLHEAEVTLHERIRELAFADESTKGARTGRKLAGWGFTNIALDDPAFGAYGGLDAIYVRRLLTVLDALIRRARMAPLSKREQRIARLATAIRVRGHRVDPEWTGDLLVEFEREYGAADKRLRETFGFSPASPDRGEWLLDRGAEFTEFTPTGRPKITMPSASAAGTLPDLARFYEGDAVLGPVFADLLKLGTHKNILTNLRIIAAAARNDGYCHPEIRTQAAHTGRMSVVKPAMQTFKKSDPRLRGCFVARDGHVLVGADYDSQEIRIAAAYSRDPALLKVVREGLNQHDLTAEMIFGPRFTPEQRAQAKTLNFAQQYGAGPRRIAAQLDLDYGEARALWLAWREAYAGLVEWSEQIGEMSVIINPWGRRVPADPWRGYASGNYAIQSTGRDVLGDALVKLDDAGWADTLWMLLHDEIVLEVPAAEAEAACAALTACMTSKIRDIPLTVTPTVIGTRWGAKEEAS